MSKPQRTLWKQPGVIVAQMPPKKPTITEIIISFDQLNAVTLFQGQLIRTSRDEIVCPVKGQSHNKVILLRLTTLTNDEQYRPRRYRLKICVLFG